MVLPAVMEIPGVFCKCFLYLHTDERNCGSWRKVKHVPNEIMAEIFLYNPKIFWVKLQPLTTAKQKSRPRFVVGRFVSSMTDKKEKKNSFCKTGRSRATSLSNNKMWLTATKRTANSNNRVTCTHFKSIASIPRAHVVRSKTFSLSAFATSSQRVLSPPHSCTAWQLL